MCNDHQQAVITRLIADIPSSRHHIIMDLVLRNQINAAEAVAEEFAKVAQQQADTMQAFLIAQEETQQAIEHHAQASRNYVVARADNQRLSELNAAFQERVIQMETEIAELQGFLVAAGDALDAAEVAAALALAIVETA